MFVCSSYWYATHSISFSPDAICPCLTSQFPLVLNITFPITADIRSIDRVNQKVIEYSLPYSYLLVQALPVTRIYTHCVCSLLLYLPPLARHGLHFV